MGGESAVEICEQLDKKWDIKTIFTAACRASGNWIVERHHQTIKEMAARAKVVQLRQYIGTT